jgi:hypothetical protein
MVSTGTDTMMKHGKVPYRDCVTRPEADYCICVMEASESVKVSAGGVITGSTVALFLLL